MESHYPSGCAALSFIMSHTFSPLFHRSNRLYTRTGVRVNTFLNILMIFRYVLANYFQSCYRNGGIERKVL